MNQIVKNSIQLEWYMPYLDQIVYSLLIVAVLIQFNVQQINIKAQLHHLKDSSITILLQ